MPCVISLCNCTANDSNVAVIANALAMISPPQFSTTKVQIATKIPVHPLDLCATDSGAVDALSILEDIYVFSPNSMHRLSHL